MSRRRSDCDVTHTIRTTDPAAVAAEIRRIYRDSYRRPDWQPIEHSFRDVTLLYAGANPRYRACDTSYHDLQHVLDVAAVDDGLAGVEAVEHVGVVGVGAVAEAHGAERSRGRGHADSQVVGAGRRVG